MAESAAASVATAEGNAVHPRERFDAAARLYERADQPFRRQRSLAQAAAAQLA
jgi:hypothetical protein